MEIKSGVLDRSGQTFEILFSKYFLLLTSLIFLYQVLNYIVISFFTHFSSQLALKEEISNITSMSTVLYSTDFLEIVVSFIIFLMLFSFVSLGITAGTIKIIKDIVNGETPKSCEEYFFYGWNKIISVMYLYFYNFMYIILIPFIILIVGSLLTGLFYATGQIEFVGMLTGFTLGGFFIPLIILAIYRGIKSAFFLMRGIDKEEYTQSGFDQSILLAEGNWWRIVGNAILVSIIIGLISSVASGIIGSIGFFSSGQGLVSIVGQNVMNGGKDLNDPEKIKLIVQGLFTVHPLDYVIGMIKIFINSIATVGTMIFMYLFYKRIEQEKDTSSSL